MGKSPPLSVQPLTEESLPAVVEIHRAGLGYTMNSRLGERHLSLLYRLMAKDSQSYVGVAMQGQIPVGVVSGTLDENQLKRRLLWALSARGLCMLVIRLALHPSLLIQWIQGTVIAMPIQHDGTEVAAVLTALAVDATKQSRGVGTRLVQALEAYYALHSVRAYRLDTLTTNERARNFYRRLGFFEVARRAGSVILLKVVEP